MKIETNEKVDDWVVRSKDAVSNNTYNCISENSADKLLKWQLEQENFGNDDKQLYALLAHRNAQLVRMRRQKDLLKVELSRVQNELEKTKKSLGNTRKSYQNMQKSWSLRIGRAITWLPRTVKKLFAAAKEKTLFKMWRHFKNDILKGFRNYSELLKKYGSEAHVYKPPGGAGDVYIAGLYFDEYVKTHYPDEKSVFLVMRQGGYQVAQLFSIENIEMLPYLERRSIVHMGIFVGFDNIRFTVLHHHPLSLYTSISKGMEVVNDLHSFEVLTETIYEGLSPIGKAQFENDTSIVESIFESYQLEKGKTVVLLPYSASMQPIRMEFWERLASILISHGYTVCTNSQGKNEPAVIGTCAINIPISCVVPFLDMAGFLVSVRSGILDVSITSKAKRVVFYPELKEQPRGQGGHNRKSLPHFSLNAWQKTNCAVEIEYELEKEADYFEQIIQYFSDGEGDING